MAQLYYDGERITVDINISMPRADDRHVPFDHVLGPVSAIKEARLHIVDTSGTTDVVVVSLNKADHSSQWDFTTDDAGIILITSANTIGLDLEAYSYAIELVAQDDTVYTPQRGSFVLSDDVVTNSGTAPYLSWSTRDDLDSDIDDLETDISDMATCGNLSWLTVAATGGAMATLDVENGAIFTALDDIRLVLTSGAYEDDVVASMNSNEITLTATIAGEAAIGAVVRIL